MDSFNFINSSKQLTKRDVNSVEIEIGRSIPDVLKGLLLQYNGRELTSEVVRFRKTQKSLACCQISDLFQIESGFCLVPNGFLYKMSTN